MKFEIPSGLHKSLNPRPELLAGRDDDLPISVGHYIQDLGLEGGQGVTRVFNWPLFQLYSMWSNIKVFAIWWAGRQHFQVIHQVGLQPVLGVQNNRGILRVRTMISVVLAICLLILIKKIYHQIRKWCDWDLLVSYDARRFYHSCRSWVLCRHGFENKDRSNECLYTFLW
jgi:hypothetical protein